MPITPTNIRSFVEPIQGQSVRPQTATNHRINLAAKSSSWSNSPCSRSAQTESQMPNTQVQNDFSRMVIRPFLIGAV